MLISFYQNNLRLNSNQSTPLKKAQTAISFGQSDLIRDNAKICAYCGQKMVTDDELSILIREIPDLKGAALVQEFRNIVPDLPNNMEIRLLRHFLEAAKAQPLAIGRQILNIMIQDAKGLVAKTNLSELLKQISEIPDLSQDVTGRLMELRTHNGLAHEEEFTLLRKLERGLISRENYTEQQRNLIEELSELVLSKFVILKGKNSTTLFAAIMCKTLLRSVEHIKAKSRGGELDANNCLYTHVACNAERGNKPFSVFTKPWRIRQNIRMSLKAIRNGLFASGQLEEARPVLRELRATIKAQGQFDVRI